MTDFNHAVKFQHTFWDEVLPTARVIVDATCGNGHDTAYLYIRASGEAVLHYIDIQDIALRHTEERLHRIARESPGEKVEDGLRIPYDEAHSVGRPVLRAHLASHDDVLARIVEETGRIDLLVFNLGYLPGASRDIMTRVETVTAALEHVLAHPERIGLVTIVTYPGTERGLAEQEVLEAFLAGVSQKDFDVSVWKPLNQVNRPPQLYVVRVRANR